MAHVLINPPPSPRGDGMQQVDDLRRWCMELAQKLEVNFNDIDNAIRKEDTK